MYKVSIFNAGVETIIHVPTPEDKAPHLLSISLQEKLSQVSNLTFVIPYMNPGYNLIQPFSTKVKVTDENNAEIYIGRVLIVSNEMNNNGVFSKTIICEDALAYLIDSNSDQNTYTNQTPTQILTILLNSHNIQVNDSSKTIQLGIVELTQAVTVNTNYESTLNAIIKNLVNILGGDIRIQERNGVLYLDYLIALGSDNGVKLKLGVNQQRLLAKYDPTNILTRIIPLGYGEGINQLNIKSVNNGLNYLDNLSSQAQYGVITNAVTNKNIQNIDTLKIWGQTYLTQNSKPALAVESDMLDLSIIDLDKPISLGDTIEVINDVMQFDIFARIVEKNTDLLAPYNPKLSIDTKPIRLSTQQVSLEQRITSLENAPQGNTVIFPLSKAENADADHPITFDLDIPKETININKVYINIHGRKYRANSKDSAAGGNNTATSSSGGTATPTSSSGGGSTYTSAIDVPSWHVSPIITNDASATSPHNHTIDPHYVEHGHTITLPNHTHIVSVPSHTHDITIPDHVHAAVYGIVENTYPNNVKIKINGIDSGVNYGDGSNSFDYYNLDITPYVNIGNNKIEISTSQNGRIEATVYCQIFIQSK